MTWYVKMIKGNVEVIWTEEDYINLPWFTNDIHEEKFNATVETKGYDVGVSMCFEDLPEVFQKVVEQFDFLDKIVIAINKLAGSKIELVEDIWFDGETDKLSVYLLIPYIMWLSFATYLSYNIYILNKNIDNN